MEPIEGHFLITPGNLAWTLARPMQVPYADYLERTRSQLLGARLWRLAPKTANTLHRHVRAEEFYFVLEGTGRIRVDDDTLTVPTHGAVLIGPHSLRQIFNDTDRDVLWLVVGAPEKEFDRDEDFDIRLFWPVDPQQLPKELDGVEWPPRAEE